MEARHLQNLLNNPRTHGLISDRYPIINDIADTLESLPRLFVDDTSLAYSSDSLS